jgi:hypothetical protein
MHVSFLVTYKENSVCASAGVHTHIHKHMLKEWVLRDFMSSVRVLSQTAPEFLTFPGFPCGFSLSCVGITFNERSDKYENAHKLKF